MLSIITFLAFYIFLVLVILLSHLFTSKFIADFDTNVSNGVETWKKLWERNKSKNEGKFRHKDIKRFKKPYMIIGFLQFMSELSEEDRILVLSNNSEVFFKVVTKADRDIKSYMAYMFSEIEWPKFDKICDYEDFFHKFALNDSVFLRENALKALYNIGSAQIISDTYIKLSEKNITHSEKLLADDLLECKCDSKELIVELMKNYDKFIECYKVAVIVYLNYKECHEYDEMFKKLLNGNEESDIQCAILRLLGKDKSTENGEFIADYINSHVHINNWQSTTVAAGVLGGFEKTDYIVKTLKNAIVSKVWSIRMNSAKSLCAIGIDNDEVNEIINGDDAFARDALEYAMNNR